MPAIILIMSLQYSELFWYVTIHNSILAAANIITQYNLGTRSRQKCEKNDVTNDVLTFWEARFGKMEVFMNYAAVVWEIRLSNWFKLLSIAMTIFIFHFFRRNVAIIGTRHNQVTHLRHKYYL